MIFRYHGLRWQMLRELGWDTLPAGARPSDVLGGEVRPFARPTPRSVLATPSRCEDEEGRRFAKLGRLAVRVGRLFQRSPSEFCSRRQKQGAHAARCFFCAAARSMGIDRETVARWTQRTAATVTCYAGKGREAMERDPGLLRAFERIVADEHIVQLCPAVLVPECRGIGGAGCTVPNGPATEAA